MISLEKQSKKMGEIHDKDERRGVKSTLLAKIESILGSSTIKLLRHTMNAIIILACVRLVEYFANLILQICCTLMTL